MKVKVKAAFLDKDGIHKKGDVLDVNHFDPFLMIAIEDGGDQNEVKEEKPKTTKKSKK